MRRAGLEVIDSHAAIPTRYAYVELSWIWLFIQERKLVRKREPAVSEVPKRLKSLTSVDDRKSLRAEPGRRGYHTLIPGMLLRDGRLWGPFGVMGGFMQAQGHVQLVSALVDDGLDPQAALDRPRFKVDGPTVFLEQGLCSDAGELKDLGEIVQSEDRWQFGCGNVVLVEDEVLVGGADMRKDGHTAGI